MTPEDHRQRSYRRGRWLLLTLAAVTAGGYGFDSVMNLLSSKSNDFHAGLVGGWLVLGFFCWSLLRGGIAGRAVFILLYSMFFLLFLLGTVCTIIAIVVEWRGQSDDNNVFLYAFHSRDSLLAGVLLGLWSAWSLWVLIISRDAEVYTRSRRRGVTMAEANAFEWPPAHRRPQ